MRTAQQIYDAYRIMPTLQLHQLRVTAVAKTICENITREVDTHAVVLACLFHDMGNIIKSDLSLFPDFTEPEGIAHWQLVKDEYVQKYGTLAHEATMMIVQEIGLQQGAIQLIDGITFSGLESIRDGESFEQKIVEYADLRVGPHGVLTLDARINEASPRYAGKYRDMPGAGEQFDKLVAAAHVIEQQVFTEADISPDDITEQSVNPIFEDLRRYEIVQG